MVLCVCVMATNFLELATTLKYLGAKWLPGKKVNFTPCVVKASVPLLGEERGETKPRILYLEFVGLLVHR